MIYTYVIIYGFEIISYPEISLQRDSGAVKGKLVACIVDIIICINFLSWISPSRALDSIEADSLSDVKD